MTVTQNSIDEALTAQGYDPSQFNSLPASVLAALIPGAIRQSAAATLDASQRGSGSSTAATAQAAVNAANANLASLYANLQRTSGGGGGSSAAAADPNVLTPYQAGVLQNQSQANQNQLTLGQANVGFNYAQLGQQGSQFQQTYGLQADGTPIQWAGLGLQGMGQDQANAFNYANLGNTALNQANTLGLNTYIAQNQATQAQNQFNLSSYQTTANVANQNAALNLSAYQISNDADIKRQQLQLAQQLGQGDDARGWAQLTLAAQAQDVQSFLGQGNLALGQQQIDLAYQRLGLDANNANQANILAQARMEMDGQIAAAQASAANAAASASQAHANAALAQANAALKGVEVQLQLGQGNLDLGRQTLAWTQQSGLMQIALAQAQLGEKSMNDQQTLALQQALGMGSLNQQASDTEQRDRASQLASSTTRYATDVAAQANIYGTDMAAQTSREKIAADAQAQRLNLLASLRGPADYFQYMKVLRGDGTPDGGAANDGLGEAHAQAAPITLQGFLAQAGASALGQNPAGAGAAPQHPAAPSWSNYGSPSAAPASPSLPPPPISSQPWNPQGPNVQAPPPPPGSTPLLAPDQTPPAPAPATPVAGDMTTDYAAPSPPAGQPAAPAASGATPPAAAAPSASLPGPYQVTRNVPTTTPPPPPPQGQGQGAAALDRFFTWYQQQQATRAQQPAGQAPPPPPNLTYTLPPSPTWTSAPAPPTYQTNPPAAGGPPPTNGGGGAAGYVAGMQQAAAAGAAANAAANPAGSFSNPTANPDAGLGPMTANPNGTATNQPAAQQQGAPGSGSMEYTSLDPENPDYYWVAGPNGMAVPRDKVPGLTPVPGQPGHFTVPYGYVSSGGGSTIAHPEFAQDAYNNAVTNAIQTGQAAVQYANQANGPTIQASHPGGPGSVTQSAHNPSGAPNGPSGAEAPGVFTPATSAAGDNLNPLGPQDPSIPTTQSQTSTVTAPPLDPIIPYASSGISAAGPAGNMASAGGSTGANNSAGYVDANGVFHPANAVPSYASGTPLVQGDQVAQLHDGEAVLTAAENPNNPDNLMNNGSTFVAPTNNTMDLEKPLGESQTFAQPLHAAPQTPETNIAFDTDNYTTGGGSSALTTSSTRQPAGASISPSDWEDFLGFVQRSAGPGLAQSFNAGTLDDSGLNGLWAQYAFQRAIANLPGGTWNGGQVTLDPWGRPAFRDAYGRTHTLGIDEGTFTLYDPQPAAPPPPTGSNPSSLERAIDQLGPTFGVTPALAAAMMASPTGAWIEQNLQEGSQQKEDAIRGMFVARNSGQSETAYLTSLQQHFTRTPTPPVTQPPPVPEPPPVGPPPPPPGPPPGQPPPVINPPDDTAAPPGKYTPGSAAMNEAAQMIMRAFHTDYVPAPNQIPVQVWNRFSPVVKQLVLAGYEAGAYNYTSYPVQDMTEFMARQQAGYGKVGVASSGYAGIAR